MKYNRILLKLSGEALMGSQEYGIDPQRLNEYADEIIEAAKEQIDKEDTTFEDVIADIKAVHSKHIMYY